MASSRISDDSCTRIPAEMVGIRTKRRVVRLEHLANVRDDSVAAQKKTLIVPDKDADGLSSGVIVHRTLVKLGLVSSAHESFLTCYGIRAAHMDARTMSQPSQFTRLFGLFRNSSSGKPSADICSHGQGPKTA